MAFDWGKGVSCFEETRTLWHLQLWFKAKKGWQDLIKDISAGQEMDCDLHTLFGVKHINEWVEVLEILLEKLKLCKFSTCYALFKIDK